MEVAVKRSMVREHRGRWRLACAGRLATVFGLAVAALASCQGYELEGGTLRLTPARELNEWAICEEAGGRWATRSKACLEGAPLRLEEAP